MPEKPFLYFTEQRYKKIEVNPLATAQSPRPKSLGTILKYCGGAQALILESYGDVAESRVSSHTAKYICFSSVPRLATAQFVLSCQSHPRTNKLRQINYCKYEKLALILCNSNTGMNQ